MTDTEKLKLACIELEKVQKQNITLMKELEHLQLLNDSYKQEVAALRALTKEERQRLSRDEYITELKRERHEAQVALGKERKAHARTIERNGEIIRHGGLSRGRHKL